MEGEGVREGVREGGREVVSSLPRVVGVFLLDLTEGGLHVLGVLVVHGRVGVVVVGVSSLGETLD